MVWIVLIGIVLVLYFLFNSKGINGVDKEVDKLITLQIEYIINKFPASSSQSQYWKKALIAEVASLEIIIFTFGMYCDGITQTKKEIVDKMYVRWIENLIILYELPTTEQSKDTIRTYLLARTAYYKPLLNNMAIRQEHEKTLEAELDGYDFYEGFVNFCYKYWEEKYYNPAQGGIEGVMNFMSLNKDFNDISLEFNREKNEIQWLIINHGVAVSERPLAKITQIRVEYIKDSSLDLIHGCFNFRKKYNLL